MTKASATPPFAMTFGAETQVNDQDTQEARPVGHVCSWCTPRAELDRLNALFPDLSHGLCAACAQKLDAEIDAREVA